MVTNGGIRPHQPISVRDITLDPINPITGRKFNTQDNLYRVYKNYIDKVRLGGMRDKEYRRGSDKYLKF